jgi:hypothetical protein
MKLEITNQGTAPTTVSGLDSASVTLTAGAQRGGVAWTVDLLQGAPLDTSSQGTQSVMIVGDKPSVTEQLQEAGNVIGDAVDAIRNRDKDALTQAGSGPRGTISIFVVNLGPNSVRAILGDGYSDQTVTPNTSAVLTAPGYIELRELGLVNPNLERQPSSAA